MDGNFKIQAAKGDVLEYPISVMPPKQSRLLVHNP